MVTGTYIWFDYTKPLGSKSSYIAWIDKINTDKAKSAINKIKAEDILKVQTSRCFSQDVALSTLCKK